MADDVRGVEEGAVDYEARGRYDHQNFGFPVLLRVLFVVSGQGGTEVDTSAGTLSEAKTQRRPHSARERVREGGFPVLLFLYLSFEQGKKNT